MGEDSNMNILTVIGARPQFIKAAAVSNVIRKEHHEILVHTGQHYDDNMSRIFFDELEIPKPDYNLEIGSGNHGHQTGSMLIKLEELYLREKPDLVLVYGDTNSTLAGALCASKLLIPVAHVEAGLRSFNMGMPEEQNRILTDHLSKLLFVPTLSAEKNLYHEGITSGVYNIGDVMYDSILHFKEISNKKSDILSKMRIIDEEFFLCTIHRAENTDNIERLGSIINALNESEKKFILPLHPRTKNYIKNYGFKFSDNIEVVEPLGYLDMIKLEMYCKKIVTDSGGVQKEAFFMGKPCITIRDETEWVETVENGWNTVIGTNKEKIIDAILNFMPNKRQDNIFGDGAASMKILNIINSTFA